MKIGTFYEYKGYTGTIEYIEESDMYYGSLIDINGLVNYQACTVCELYDEFKNSVDDYIEFKNEMYSVKGW